MYVTTVNRTDCGVLSGKPFVIRFFTGLLKPRSRVPGTDFAGQIEEIGKDVKHFKVGDKVWGLDDEGLGSQAEYMVISENKAVLNIPDTMTYKEVVACAEGAYYAYNFINKIKIKLDDKVLVNGATGGIGSAALQILKHRGALVTAVGDTDNLDLLKSLGADKVWDYMKEDFTRDKQKYHFILDAVGKSSFFKCTPLLLPKGIYISSELGPKSQNLYLPLLTMFGGGKRVIFPLPMNCKRSLLYIKGLIEKGEFKAVIDREFPLDKIKEAYTYVASGQKTGNVIVNF